MKGKLQLYPLIILCLVLLSNGCSVVSIAYNYADWIILRKLDNYFDVTPQQEEFLEREIVILHHWHRTSELPLYVGFLDEIQQDVQSGLSPERLDYLLLTYQELRSHLAQKLAVHGTPFLINLTPEQQRFFKAVLQQENQALSEDLGDTPEERLRNRMEKAMDILEFWLEDITPDQQPVIQELVRIFPDTTEEYLRYREYRQQEFLHILEHKADTRQVERAVAEWMNSSGRDVPQQSYTEIQEWQHAVKTVILEVDKIATPSQRQYLANKLKSIIRTLQTLTST